MLDEALQITNDFSCKIRDRHLMTDHAMQLIAHFVGQEGAFVRMVAQDIRLERV